jgi:hypothetical protein
MIARVVFYRGYIQPRPLFQPRAPSLRPADLHPFQKLPFDCSTQHQQRSAARHPLAIRLLVRYPDTSLPSAASALPPTPAAASESPCAHRVRCCPDPQLCIPTVKFSCPWRFNRQPTALPGPQRLDHHIRSRSLELRDGCGLRAACPKYLDSSQQFSRSRGLLELLGVTTNGGRRH